MLLKWHAVILSFIASAILVAWLQGRGRNVVRAMDRPGGRSLHVVPTPRTGGIGIGSGVLVGIAATYPLVNPFHLLVLYGFLMVFCVSVIDDFRDTPFWLRLVVHVTAATMIVLGSGMEAPPLVQVLAIFAIIWATNLFNFMDGMDGLAATMAVIGGGALALAFLQAGVSAPALLLLVAAAATAAFLWFNFPPARIFMGDAGAAPLGFLFAAMGLSGVASGQLPGWLPLLVFLPFIADATFTLLRRAWRRKPVWRAHREHAYQVLVLSGWSVRRVLAAYGLLMLLCSVLALLLPRSGWSGWLALLGIVCLLAIVYWVIMSRHDQRESR